VGKSVLIIQALQKNNLNFVKDVPMTYVNILIIVVIVFEKEIGGITFKLPLVVYADVVIITLHVTETDVKSSSISCISLNLAGSCKSSVCSHAQKYMNGHIIY
jgi:hypothetical protein